MSLEAAYTLKDTASLATFDVLVDSDRTMYGRPNLIRTERLNVGITNTESYGSSPDTRNLGILLLGATKGAKFTTLETLFKTDSVKTLVFPDIDNDGSSTATVSGEYMMAGMDKTVGANVISVRITLQAKTSDAVT